MIRDLVRIRCCVALQESNCHYVGSPTFLMLGRQIFGYPPASGSYNRTDSNSSLLPLPCCFFLGASSLAPHLTRLSRLSALVSTSYRSFFFSLERLGWSRHWGCNVDCRRSRRRLIKVVLVEQADELSKVLDR